ncbi:MAG: phosphoesterase PA-phosphatase related protein [Bacteroidetes bacterium]|nr:phosphoesterase PA-phosphatase related protein [Bacteroidota bacterium]
MRRIPTTLLLCSALLCPSLAQTSTDLNIPTRPQVSRTGLTILGTMAITFVLIQTDQQTYDFTHSAKERNSVFRTLSPIITEIGHGSFSFGTFGGFLAYGFLADDKRAIRTGEIGLESFLLTGVTIQFIKRMTGRERPSSSTSTGGTWYGPMAFFNGREREHGQARYDAFPSGHTAAAFSLATVLSDMYPEPWVSYLSYTLATSVAVTRISESTHWASDCFLGAIIGYGCTKLVERWNDDSEQLSLKPYTDQVSYGVQLQLRF